MVRSCGRCVFSLLKICQKLFSKVDVSFCIPTSNTNSAIKRNGIQDVGEPYVHIAKLKDASLRGYNLKIPFI